MLSIDLVLNLIISNLSPRDPTSIRQDLQLISKTNHKKSTGFGDV